MFKEKKNRNGEQLHLVQIEKMAKKNIEKTIDVFLFEGVRKFLLKSYNIYFCLIQSQADST